MSKETVVYYALVVVVVRKKAPKTQASWGKTTSKMWWAEPDDWAGPYVCGAPPSS